MILAHQGGWDEMAMVGVPIALFGGLLYLANRRAEARLAERDAAGGEEATNTDEDDLSPPSR